MIVIIVTPQGCGLFKAHLGRRLVLESSTQPLLDAARALAGMGVPPDTPISMRHEGASYIALSSTIGQAARLAVDDDRQGVPRFRRTPSQSSVTASPMRFGERPAPTLALEPFSALSNKIVEVAP